MLYSNTIVFDFVYQDKGIWILLCFKVCQFKTLSISVTLLGGTEVI